MGICCDNVDSLHVWAAAMGTIGFPILSDFWPHGKVSEQYGVLNENGVPDRVHMLLDKNGRVCYLDNEHIEVIPPNAPLLDACKLLS